jgi:hypothetical protein
MKIKSYSIPGYEYGYVLSISVVRICFGTIQYRPAAGKVTPEAHNTVLHMYIYVV